MAAASRQGSPPLPRGDEGDADLLTVDLPFGNERSTRPAMTAAVGIDE